MSKIIDLYCTVLKVNRVGRYGGTVMAKVTRCDEEPSKVNTTIKFYVLSFKFMGWDVNNLKEGMLLKVRSEFHKNEFGRRQNGRIHTLIELTPEGEPA